MVETWARNWMSSILKMFQRLYHFHPSIPPTTNYISFDAHAAQEPLTFDSDAVRIGFDTHASTTMSGRLEMFQDLIFRDDLGTCGGISGGLEIKGLGTFILKLDDDNGRRHTITIPNSLYIPDLKQTLVCPQHWAQEANDHVPE